MQIEIPNGIIRHMKKCSRCTKTKEYSDFAKRSAAKDGLANWCKLCFKEYDRDRYRKGDKSRKDKNRLERIEKIRVLLWDYLCNSSCPDCGETDPEVLEFDHLDPSKKEANVSDMLRSRSWESILGEIKKCEVVCANCHRKRTIKQFGFWRGSRVNGV